MKRLLMTAAAALSMMTAAHAEDRRHLYQSGYWEVQQIFSTRSGNGDQCVMSGSWVMTATKIKHLVMLKWNNAGGFFVQIHKSGWNFPNDLSVPLTYTFKAGTRPADALTISMEGSDIHMLETMIKNDIALAVLWDFAETSTLTITFKQGNEKPWVLPMAGSRDATFHFAACVKTLTVDGTYNPFASSTSPVPQAGTSPVPQAKSTSPVAPQAKPTSPVKRRDDGSV